MGDISLGRWKQTDGNCSSAAVRELSPWLQAMFFVRNVLKPARSGNSDPQQTGWSLVFLPSGSSTRPASRELLPPEPREINRKSPRRKCPPQTPK